MYIETLAFIFGLLALYPKFIKIYNTKDVDSYSKRSLYFSLISLSLWLYYHIQQGQGMNSLSVIFYIALDAYILYLFK